MLPQMLAFTPLYDPLPALYPGMSDHWIWLVIPLVLAISIVYKTTRLEKLADLPREAAVMTAQMLIVMVVAAALLSGGYWAYLRVS
jgi:hypothetical protein